MGGENGVVGLDNGVGHCWRGVYRELELGLLAVVGREAFENEGTEPGAGSTTEGVEDEEALKTTAVVCKAADLIHHNVNHLLTHSVVTTGVCSKLVQLTSWHPKQSRTVARSILFASNESLGVEETPVGARPDLVDDIGFEIDVKRARDVLSRRGLREESAEAVIVGRGRALNETTVRLLRYLDASFECRRVDTYAETVLDGVELPCESYDRQ